MISGAAECEEFVDFFEKPSEMLDSLHGIRIDFIAHPQIEPGARVGHLSDLSPISSEIGTNSACM